jgi:multisubunit Na+/H+ antiporter MnhB subunit
MAPTAWPSDPWTADAARGPGALTVADSKAARLDIPYLGPVPPGSRPMGRATQLAWIVGAVTLLGRAVLYAQREGLDQQLVRGETASLAAQISSNQSSLDVVNVIVLAGALAACVLSYGWQMRRRPRRVRVQAGEAWVESPMSWITPLWYRVLIGGLVGVSVVLSSGSTPTRTTRTVDLAGLRHQAMISSILFAVAWAAGALSPWFADRAFDRRLAASGPARENPGAVPFFPYVGRGAWNGEPSVGEPSGLGWMFRTFGLVMATILSVFFLIGSISDLAGPHPEPGVDLLFLAVGAAGMVLVVWAFRRRWQRRAAARAS